MLRALSSLSAGGTSTAASAVAARRSAAPRGYGWMANHPPPPQPPQRSWLAVNGAARLRTVAASSSSAAFSSRVTSPPSFGSRASVESGESKTTCGGRSYSSSPARLLSSSPLDEFRDPLPRQQRMSERVGRSWTATELRRKSYQDLHRLWYVLYKERNMLLTELQLSRRRGLLFPQPERMKKVRKSMGAIRQVLGERKREKIAAFRRERQEQQQLEDAEMQFHE